MRRNYGKGMRGIESRKALYALIKKAGGLRALAKTRRSSKRKASRRLWSEIKARGNPRAKRFSASPRGIVKAVRAALRAQRAGKRVRISVRTKR